MRRSRVLSKKRANALNANLMLGSDQKQDNLTCNLHKVYIRNFHEYHHRTKVIGETKTAKDEYDRQMRFDHKQQRMKAIENAVANESESSDQINTYLINESNEKFNKLSTFCNYSFNGNVLENETIEKLQIPPIAPLLSSPASAIIRKSRYSVKTCFGRNQIIGESKLKQLKLKRIALKQSKRVTAYKVEHLKDNLEQLQSEVDILNHKLRFVNRECTLVSRDIDKMKQNYKEVAQRLFEKDFQLKENGKFRLYNQLPILKINELNLLGDLKIFYSLFDTQNLAWTSPSIQLIYPEYHECDLEKTSEIKSEVSQVDCNKLGVVLQTRSITPEIKEQNMQQYTNDLLEYFCTEKGSAKLNIKLQQLFIDNQNAREKANELRTEIQKFKNLSINETNQLITKNFVPEIGGISRNRHTVSCLNLAQRKASNRRSLSNQQNENIQKTWIVNNQIKPNWQKTLLSKSDEHLNEELDCRKVRLQLKVDEAKLSESCLRNHQKALKMELIQAETNVQEKNTLLDQIKNDLQISEKEVKAFQAKIHLLKIENEHLLKRLEKRYKLNN